MGKFIDLSVIPQFRSPISIQRSLEHARRYVVKRIRDIEDAGRKGESEWHDAVRDYNIYNEMADAFITALEDQAVSMGVEFSTLRRLDNRFFPRLAYGKDREMPTEDTNG